jgi:hypothetical protein
MQPSLLKHKKLLKSYKASICMWPETVTAHTLYASNLNNIKGKKCILTIHTLTGTSTPVSKRIHVKPVLLPTILQ